MKVEGGVGRRSLKSGSYGGVCVLNVLMGRGEAMGGYWSDVCNMVIVFYMLWRNMYG